MFRARLALLFTICSWSHFLTSQETVKVTLYYEALCPFSVEFINKQLYPGYQMLGSSLNLELIPYGNAEHKKVDGKWQFTCQHGPDECYVNKLHACALNNNSTQKESMDFIGCSVNSTNPEKKSNARKCAKQAKLSWKTIKKCANGEEGDELLAHYGDLTLHLYPFLEYVPHLLFNGKANRTLEIAANKDFVDTICNLYSDKPLGCYLAIVLRRHKNV